MRSIFTLLNVLLLISLWGTSNLAYAEATTAEKEETESQATTDEETTVLVPVFSFDGPLLESPVADDPLFGAVGAESLKDLTARLEKAKEDDEVKAVVLLIGNSFSMGVGQTEEVRNALQEIRDAGKPIYAYADSLSFPQLALLSVASRISVAPVGDLFITGLYGEQPHLRGLLDKIHVSPDFITCGEYKSASEIFMRNEPSPEAERMYNWLYDSIYENLVGMIAEGRNKNREEVRGWINDGLYSAEKAEELGIIDAVEFRQQLEEHVRKEHGDQAKFPKKYGKDKGKDLDLSSPFAAFQIWAEILSGGTKQETEKPGVAIVYVEGPIVPGDAEPSLFGSQGIAYSNPIRKALEDAAEDESVKAVVLRVDSPGGSAVASEIILGATKQVAEKKPFVVSMGNVAGSGGYYVSCGTDTIFADACTITASIGVVAGKLATKEMWQALGVHWHPIERGENAGMLSSGEVFSDEQKENLQTWMNEVYDVFKNHVTEARGDRLSKPIEELAGGRVFTGRQALEHGLVDRIGTLQDAIEYAAKEAELGDDYDVRVLPKPKNFIEELFSDLKSSKKDEDTIHLDTAPMKLRNLQSLWQAATPLLEKLEPQRAASLRRVLLQLEILQQERVSLTMPEINFAN